jgi:hypothetical protein
MYSFFMIVFIIILGQYLLKTEIFQFYPTQTLEVFHSFQFITSLCSKR